MVIRDDLMPEVLTDQQHIVVQKILNTWTSDTPRYPTASKRTERPKPAQDIDGFTDLVMRVIDEQQIRDEVPEKLKVKFLQDLPPNDISTEVITFGLLRRNPGSFSQGQHFNQNVRELKPHVRGIEDDPTRPGYKTIILGQTFENEIVLTCWAKTNKQANKRARWLEDTLRNWTWYIKYEGIMEFYFLGQDEDMTLPLGDSENVIMGRPLRYYVRTERLSHVLEPTIRHIVIKYGLGAENTSED